jgi:hypothetical protein
MGKAKFCVFFDLLISAPPYFCISDQNARAFEKCPLT